MPIYDGLNNAGVAASKPAGTSDLGQGTQGHQYLENATATPWGRLEPLLTPDQLKSRYLKGIPMVLKIKDPATGKPYTITDDELKDYIELAVDEAENETGLVLMPTQFTEKLPFQKQDYESFGYFQLPRRPIASIEALNVTLADGSDVFVFPTEWLETSNLIHGQLNILPLAFQGMQGGTGVVGGVSAGSGTAVFFNSLWNRPWVAALFGVTYTAGFKNGLMPKYVNNLIGLIVAMRVLSMIAAAYATYQSVSLGMDGMSQSVSTPGPQRFKIRIEELEKERALVVRKLKKAFGSKFVVGTI
jgi:hypothetical protein